jgi:hypothetical protein
VSSEHDEPDGDTEPTRSTDRPRSVRSTLVRFALLVLALPLAGLVLVIAADSIPDRLVMDSLFEATVSGSLDAEPYGVGYAGGRTDEFSECKRITIGLGAPPGMGVLESAVRSPTLGACPTAIPRIIGWAEGDGLARSYDYYRYWNGSSVVFRPSIALLGVDGTRLVAALSLTASAAWFGVQLARRAGAAAAVVMLAPLIATTDFIDLPGALLHALGMVVILLTGALLLRFLTPTAPVATVAMASFAAGAAFLFLADLTNPDAAWTLTIAVVALIALQLGSTRAMLVRMLAAAGAWIAGFAWMWAGKWLVAGVVIGFDEVRSAVTNQVELRLGGEQSGATGDPLDNLRRTWHEWWSQPLTGLVVLGCIVAVMVVALRRRDLGSTWRRRGALCLPALIPLLWYSVLRNHTYLHAWFVYRSLAVSFGVVLLAFAARMPSPRPAGAVPSGDGALVARARGGEAPAT